LAAVPTIDVFAGLVPLIAPASAAAIVAVFRIEACDASVCGTV